VLSYWKKKYLSKGREGLKASYKKVDPQIRALEEENARLKKIIGNQALELEFKTELLKKSDAHFQKGRK
jgi:putative transposase